MNIYTYVQAWAAVKSGCGGSENGAAGAGGSGDGAAMAAVVENGQALVKHLMGNFATLQAQSASFCDAVPDAALLPVYICMHCMNISKMMEIFKDVYVYR